MTRKRRKFITDSDNSDDERPNKSTKNKDSSDSLSESSEEEEWTLNTESRKSQPKKSGKKDDKKNANSAGSMESSDEGELTESENESLSEDSDDAAFNDGLDENCVGDAEDRNKLMNMTEAERERVLFERMEKRESMKTRQEIQRKLKLQKKKEEAAKLEADRKKNEQESKAAARAQRMRKPVLDDKGKGKAIDELKAKREAHKAKLKSNERRSKSPEPKPLLKTKDVYTDDDDDDEKSLSSSVSSAESADESDRESTPEVVRYISTKEQLSKIRLSRFKLEKCVHLPFFKDTVCGCFIRIGIGDKMGKKVYRVAEIFDVVTTPKTYSLGNVKTNKGLKVRHGLAENMYRLEFVSNQDFTESEFMKWKTTLEANNLKLPPVKFVDTKHKQIQEAMNHDFTEEEIEYIVKEKQKFRKNPRNYAAKKSDILTQKHLAETVGDYAEVEKLKADLEDIEVDADRLSKMRNKSLTAISYINDKNRLRTTEQIEEALKNEYQEERLSEPNPFQRRKTVPSVVTPNFQATEDAAKHAEILKKLAEERERRESEAKKSAEDVESKKAESANSNKVVDPFELHNDCDIDIDIGPVDSAPAISPSPDTSASGRRRINLSDYNKRVGLM